MGPFLLEGNEILNAKTSDQIFIFNSACHSPPWFSLSSDRKPEESEAPRAAKRRSRLVLDQHTKSESGRVSFLVLLSLRADLGIVRATLHVKFRSSVSCDGAPTGDSEATPARDGEL